MPDISTEKQYYVSSKNRTIALLLTCVGFFGVAGLQRLYVGKTVSGILYLLTCGGFLLGSIYDLYSVYNETFTDCDGFPLFADSSLKSNYHRRTPHKSVNYFALGFFYEAANSAYEEIKESYSKEDYDSVKTKLTDMEIKYASTPASSKAISEFGDYKEKVGKRKSSPKKEADNKAYEDWLEKAKVEWDKKTDRSLLMNIQNC